MILAIVAAGTAAPIASANDESDYYRLVTILSSKAPTGSRAKFWKPPPRDLVLEVSGMAPVGRKRLAVSIRKGEVWFPMTILRRTSHTRDSPRRCTSRSDC